MDVGPKINRFQAIFVSAFICFNVVKLRSPASSCCCREVYATVEEGELLTLKDVWRWLNGKPIAQLLRSTFEQQQVVHRTISGTI